MTTAPLQRFIAELDALVSDPSARDETKLLPQVEAAMRTLVQRDDWLAEEFTVPHPQYYQQYLLHADPQDRYSVVSFVWGPGQRTPVHDHTVWGVIGMLRGAEHGQRYAVRDGTLAAVGAEERLAPGDVTAVSPAVGDVHRVRNAFDDQVSISVHVYGGNIGKIERHVFDETTGAAKPFVSGYANQPPAELQIHKSAGLTRLVLNRPRLGNSLSAALVGALAQAVEACHADGTRLLVLESNGANFCTGFDLSQLDTETDDTLLARFVRVELLLQAVYRAPFATLALVRGRAFGAGADLFAACEQRWLVGPAQFSFPGAAFGLVLGTARLARRVGATQAREWIRSGAVFQGEDALKTGLASRALAEDELAPALAQLLAGAQRLDAATQAAIHQASLNEAPADAALELQALTQSAARPGLRERIVRYRQKTAR